MMSAHKEPAGVPERPTRMERSIYGWLSTAGPHRAKVSFGDGEMENFVAQAKRMSLAGVRFLFFDSPQQVAWILVDDICEDPAEKDAEIERFSASLARFARLANSLGSKIYFVAPRK